MWRRWLQRSYSWAGPAAGFIICSIIDVNGGLVASEVSRMIGRNRASQAGGTQGAVADVTRLAFLCWGGARN